jgi:hypothetical protein
VVHGPDNFMSRQVSYRHAWRKAKSYLYILYWDRRYFARVWSIHKLVPVLLVGLSLLEVVGSLLHFVKWLDDITEDARIGIAMVLLVVAVLMVWHHSRLESRVERHQAIMARGSFARERSSTTITMTTAAVSNLFIIRLRVLSSH